MRLLLRELPAHLALARSGGHALEGYRLNVLRIACDMSCTGAFQVSTQWAHSQHIVRT